MTQGVKFNPSDISDIVYKYRGSISKIARHYNVNRDTIYEYFKRHPNGIEVIKKSRDLNSALEVEASIAVMRFHLSFARSNPLVAQRAAMYFIDRKGDEYGFSKNKDIDDQNVGKILDVDYGFEDSLQVQSEAVSTQSSESTP